MIWQDVFNTIYCYEGTPIDKGRNGGIFMKNNSKKSCQMTVTIMFGV